uniref:Uncharacterized protein n=1 Tax=Timema bartmani TaxID=61472 RepID=A0A7R9EMF5_9NEOP|nr:unnamed protein product [Timema bartmani]
MSNKDPDYKAHLNVNAKCGVANVTLIDRGGEGEAKGGPASSPPSLSRGTTPSCLPELVSVSDDVTRPRYRPPRRPPLQPPSTGSMSIEDTHAAPHITDTEIRHPTRLTARQASLEILLVILYLEILANTGSTGSPGADVWRRSLMTLVEKKTTLATPNMDSNPDLSINNSIIYCKSDALEPGGPRSRSNEN